LIWACLVYIIDFLEINKVFFKSIFFVFEKFEILYLVRIPTFEASFCMFHSFFYTFGYSIVSKISFRLSNVDLGSVRASVILTIYKLQLRFKLFPGFHASHIIYHFVKFHKIQFRKILEGSLSGCFLVKNLFSSIK